MDISFDKLVTLKPQEGAAEALVCGPEGCTPVPDPEPVPAPEPGDHV